MEACPVEFELGAESLVSGTAGPLGTSSCGDAVVDSTGEALVGDVFVSVEVLADVESVWLVVEALPSGFLKRATKRRKARCTESDMLALNWWCSLWSFFWRPATRTDIRKEWESNDNSVSSGLQATANRENYTGKFVCGKVLKAAQLKTQ